MNADLSVHDLKFVVPQTVIFYLGIDQVRSSDGAALSGLKGRGPLLLICHLSGLEKDKTQSLCPVFVHRHLTRYPGFHSPQKHLSKHNLTNCSKPLAARKNHMGSFYNILMSGPHLWPIKPEPLWVGPQLKYISKLPAYPGQRTLL